MPRNQFQRMVFAFFTVVITVHAYVFYSLYVINGDKLIAATGENGVLAAINAQGGVYMFGRMMPIWAVVLIEFWFAYILENILGSPLSFKLALRVFNPKKNHPMMFETAIICATVSIMCPAMSFIAAFLYYPYYAGFDLIKVLADWLKLMCFNFPFAYFTQLFFIQPTVRSIFRLVFKKDIELRKSENNVPKNEQEAIEDIYRRIDEIKFELDEEMKKLENIEPYK